MQFEDTGMHQNRRRDLLIQAGGIAAGLAFGGKLSAAGQDASEGPMARRPIGTSGESLPVIGLGTWQTFDVGASAAERRPLAEVLEVFTAMGGRVIDSSPMYGRSEQVAGDLIAALKLAPPLFVATKVWISGKQNGVRQMQESMAKLRVPRCDLMQVHNLLDVDTHLDTLADMKTRGLIRYTGITHYTGSGAEAVARVIERRHVDFVQINYSVAEREAESRLLPLCLERGIALLANRPFAGGDVIRSLNKRPLPAWAGAVDCASWAQLLLKFVVGHPAITCAIPASGKAAHVRDNMTAGKGVMPDEKMRQRIADAVRAG
jgi:diketogulonate reductase-like aldo/keto reductase